jgi:uncharacterized protein (DUF58 family)
MTPRELARRVRLTELRGRKVAGGVVSGAYHSAFKGQGIEFLEVREYVPGDDTRSIDWNVTARMGRPHLKRFAEEREQTVILMVDGSRSSRFGSGAAQKSDTAAEVYAVLASAASRNKDQTGAIIFTSEVEVYVPPGRGESHVLRLIRELLVFQPKQKGTNIGRALDFLSRVRRRRCLVFLISDFQDERYEAPLRTAAKRQDLVALSIFDPREEQLPDCGLMEMEDAESGELCTIDTADPDVRRLYAYAAEERLVRLRETLSSAGVDHLRIETGTDYFPLLVAFLRVHGKRA